MLKIQPFKTAMLSKHNIYITANNKYEQDPELLAKIEALAKQQTAVNTEIDRLNSELEKNADNKRAVMDDILSFDKVELKETINDLAAEKDDIEKDLAYYGELLRSLDDRIELNKDLIKQKEHEYYLKQLETLPEQMKPIACDIIDTAEELHGKILDLLQVDQNALYSIDRLRLKLKSSEQPANNLLMPEQRFYAVKEQWLELNNALCQSVELLKNKLRLDNA